MALTRYVEVMIANDRYTVRVDRDALVSIKTLRLSFQHYTGKVKIHRNDGASHTLGSLAEQLYGSSYRYARHINTNPLDLRRTSFAQSKARLNRMQLV